MITSIQFACILKVIWCSGSLCTTSPTALSDAMAIRDTKTLPLLIIAGIESRYEREAESPAGAYGLFQITQSAEEHMNTMHKLKLDRRKPIDNMTLGMLYYEWLLSRYDGNIARVLIGYNWGPANADKMGWVNSGNFHLARLPTETSAYLTKYMEIKNKCE